MNSIDYWTTVALIGLAVDVVVPLGLHVLEIRPAGPVLAVAGGGAIASFAVPAGPVAGALAMPWLLGGTALTIGALGRLRASRVVEDVGLPLATGWLAMAAAWLVVHRLGLQPFGFDRAITLLTVAHFHYAGFGVTTLLLAGRTRLGRSRRLTAAMVLLQLAMVTVAMGITFDDRLELTGAVVLIGALALWSAAALPAAQQREVGAGAAALLILSGIAWAIPMVLALGWALGPFLPEPVVTTFRVMLGFHATIQSLGLVLAGLAGLALVRPRPTSERRETDAEPAPTAA